jgi:oligopeptide/dipeptide ABC transporter ATP-binding protein
LTALLEISGLRKLFPVDGGRHLHAVDGVDFAVEEGDSLGIVGESGSGKSTLARMLAGIIAATDGRIVFDGAEITPATRSAKVGRPAIQLVFQSADESLNPAFSAARNIATGIGRIRLSRETLEKVSATAADVGLNPDLLARRPHQLSGGQQARVGIARALISEPRLLILDEPTAALDVSIQATVLKLIDALRQKLGVAIVFISHDLDVVRLMCGRILVLYLGRPAEIGPAATILSAPLHPYTRALVSASPSRGRPAALPGEVTSPIDPDANACLFRARCAYAVERCGKERPPLRDVGGRLVACHRADEIVRDERAGQ